MLKFIKTERQLEVTRGWRERRNEELLFNDGNDKPVCETAKETQMYRTVFWTLWERGGGMILENIIKTCIISYKK